VSSQIAVDLSCLLTDLDDPELDELGREADQLVRVDVRIFSPLIPTHKHRSRYFSHSNTCGTGNKCELLTLYWKTATKGYYVG